MFLISCTLFALAAFFNAAIEQIAHHNGGRFRLWFAQRKAWLRWFNAFGDSWRIENEQIRLWRWWRLLPMIPAFLSDAWHLFKMLSVVSLIAAVVMYRPAFGLLPDIGVLYGVREVVMYWSYHYIFAASRPKIQLKFPSLKKS